MLKTLVEGRKMEAYTEHRTRDMHACWMCQTICYRKKPARKIGDKWICIDCLRELKESLDTLKQWEEEINLEGEMKKHLDEDLGL